MPTLSSSNASQQHQHQQVERLISNRELFASMTLEAYDEKKEEEAQKNNNAQQQKKVSNAQAKKEYEDRERQNINTRHIIHCMKRALFRSLSLREMREALRPLDPATDFDMMTKVNFDGVHTRHDAPVLGGLCCSTVATREDEIQDQRAALEGDGMRLPAYLRRSTTMLSSASNEPINNNNNNGKSNINVGTNNNTNINDLGNSVSMLKNGGNNNNSKNGGSTTNENSKIVSGKEQQINSAAVTNASSSKKVTMLMTNEENNNQKKDNMMRTDPKSPLIPSASSTSSSTNNNGMMMKNGGKGKPVTMIPVDNSELQSSSSLLLLPPQKNKSSSSSLSPLNFQNNNNNRKSRSDRNGGGGFSSLFFGSSSLKSNNNNDSDNYTDSDDDSSSDDTDFDLEVSSTLPFGSTSNNNNNNSSSPSTRNNNNSNNNAADNPSGINTEHVDPTKNIQFQFTDFAPMCYRHIRHFFGIEPETFLKVLVESNWHSIPTPGKSSAQLYFCGQNWVIKTMTAGESDFLSRILHRYYYHVRDNQHTLLPHFVGHHRLKFKDVDGSDMEFTFVIMQNVFATPLKIHTKFDLKGSTVGRFATAEEKKKTTCTQKDLDINRPLRLGEQRKNLLLEQLRRDCDFLRRSEIMDYSFLVGIHDMSKGYPVWHNVSGGGGSGSFSGGVNSTSNNNNNHNNLNGIFGDFNSIEFNAALERQNQQQMQKLKIQQQQQQQDQDQEKLTKPISAPPLVSITNASITDSSLGVVDPTNNNHNNNTTTATAELGNSSALSLTGSYNNSNNNVLSGAGVTAATTTNMNESHSQRRKRAQSGIHNHPHLQPYQQQQQHVDPMLMNSSTNNANASALPSVIITSASNVNNDTTTTINNNNNAESIGSRGAPRQGSNLSMIFDHHQHQHHHQIQQQQQQQQQQQSQQSSVQIQNSSSNNNNNNNNNNHNMIMMIFNDERCFTADSGGMMSMRRDEIYYLGVIDILQEYNWWKKAESVIMGTIHDRDRISSVDPRTYATRFIDFMESIVI